MKNGNSPSMFQRAAEATQYLITGIKPDTWMSPLQPLDPGLPEVVARQYDYSVGRNINYTPRAGEFNSFNNLRSMALNCELLRLGIETRKDQMDALKWQFKLKVDDAKANLKDPRITELTKFFEMPDKINDWSSWQRSILEEVFVTDATSIYRRMNRGNKLYALEQIDGSTIFPLIDAGGRRPIAPSPAYQQILKGQPKVDYTSNDLIYAVRNVRVYTPYGFSPTEQVIQSARTEIERMKSQYLYFTAGSTPDTYATMPADMSNEQTKAFEQRLNGLLSGNLEDRRKIPVFMHGTTVAQIKQPPLKDDFDEWLARKICYALSLPPTAFTKQMNRATADSAKESASEEGLEPVKLWIKRIIDRVVFENFGYDDIEFAWTEEKEQDLKEAADIDQGYVKTGIKKINEVRDALGLEPVEGGDVNLVLTPTGYVEITERPPPPPDLSGGPDGDVTDPNAPPKPGDDKKPAPDAKPKPTQAEAAAAAKLKKKENLLRYYAIQRSQ